MTDEIEGAFKDEVEVEVETETPEPVEAEPEQEQEPAKAESEPAKAEVEDKPDESLVPRAAVLDERHKRQRLEKENAELRQKLPQEQEPDPLDDPEAYRQYVKEKVRKELQAEENDRRRKLLDESRSAMLEKAGDYEEMERVFEVMAARNKDLVDKMLQSSDPARFAYETASDYVESVIPKKTVTTETTVEDDLKELPNLAKAAAAASNKVEVLQEADIEDVFADVNY